MTVRRDAERRVVRVEGRLDGGSVEELRRLVAAESPAVPATLDLSGLVSLDAGGQALLAALRAAGHVLVGGSLYVSRLLQEVEP